MAKKSKYYAVRVGRTPGIYMTWEDCKSNVHGFAGAVYKSFESVEEAVAFVKGNAPGSDSGIEPDRGSQLAPGTEPDPESQPAPGIQPSSRSQLAPGTEPDRGSQPNPGNGNEIGGAEAVAYVDGSYNINTKEYSFGMVIFYDGKEECFSQKFSDPQMAEMRNVAGEIEGSMRAMRFCSENGIRSLDIYYDYMGIEAWCTGDWKTNKEGTKRYKKFYEEVKENVAIRFIKVKGHSNDKYNDKADQLAKQALGIKA